MRKFLFTLSLIMPFLAFSQTYYAFTEKSSVNLRANPSTNSAKVGSIKKGEMIAIEDTDDFNWYKTEYNNQTAYVYAQLVEVCDAVIPTSLYNTEISSVKAWDRIRVEGTIQITPISSSHAIITMGWMRVNLPYETWNYLAEIKGGRITATHQLSPFFLYEGQTLEDILKDDSASILSKQIPMGYREFKGTIFFNDATFSLYK